jgi:hypothetical protein
MRGTGIEKEVKRNIYDFVGKVRKKETTGKT